MTTSSPYLFKLYLPYYPILDPFTIATGSLYYRLRSYHTRALATLAERSHSITHHPDLYTARTHACQTCRHARTHRIAVKLRRSEGQAVGLALHQAPDGSTLISAVAEHSAAALHGGIRVGDALLAIGSRGADGVASVRELHPGDEVLSVGSIFPAGGDEFELLLERKQRARPPPHDAPPSALTLRPPTPVCLTQKGQIPRVLKRPVRALIRLTQVTPAVTVEHSV